MLVKVCLGKGRRLCSFYRKIVAIKLKLFSQRLPNLLGVCIWQSGFLGWIRESHLVRLVIGSHTLPSVNIWQPCVPDVLNFNDILN
jgi:hypothetical protein